MQREKEIKQCTYIDYADPALDEKLKGLVPINGICIFIDICGSTALKYEGSRNRWIFYIKNTFEKCMECLPKGLNPVNIIGDALFYFISDDLMNELDKDICDIFEGLVDLVKLESDEFYKPVKIGVSYCTNIYNISFFENRYDFYGTGIDFTSRLLSIASDQEIIMNNAFFNKLKKEQNRNEDIDESFSEKWKIYGPMPMKFKGFSNDRIFYKFKISQKRKTKKS